MDDLAKHKRAKKYMPGKKNKSNGYNSARHAQNSPKGILDIIETDYPDRYAMMVEDHNQEKASFSKEEWVDILTESRNSYKSHLKRIEKISKHFTHEKKIDITENE